MTAEQAPETNDLDYLLKLITGQTSGCTAIVVNCQVGMGRSTTGTVVASLIYNWMDATGRNGTAPASPLIRSPFNEPETYKLVDSTPHIDLSSSSLGTKRPQRVNYTIINTLLRVVKNGSR